MQTQTPVIHVRLRADQYAMLQARAEAGRRKIAEQVRIEIEAASLPLGAARVAEQNPAVPEVKEAVERKPRKAVKSDSFVGGMSNSDRQRQMREANAR